MIKLIRIEYNALDVFSMHRVILILNNTQPDQSSNQILSVSIKKNCN